MRSLLATIVPTAALLTLLLPLPARAEIRFADAPPVLPGIDVLAAEGFKPLLGKRVGLITNPTGINVDLRSTVDVLHRAGGLQLAALYGPEHGVRGDTPAGDKIEDATDSVTGVPTFSLYGATRKPTAGMLRDIDVLVYDIQDNGSRSYTYISTMAAAMSAAAEHKIPFVVLDRPNPLGGDRIEGRPLDLKFKSFVGYLPIPYVYGMTCGELARMINGEKWLEGGGSCDLTVIAMRGWERSMTYGDTRLPWVPPSPHIPRWETSLFYAATGIMGELQAINEGVGYPLPFELAGAPGIDAEKFAAALNARNLPGVHFRPTYYQPYYTRYEKQACGGVQIMLTDPPKAHLTAIQFHIMTVVRELYPSITLFGSPRDNMFDKVCGTDEIRRLFERNRPLEDILRAWDDGIERFKSQRRRYLLYK